MRAVTTALMMTIGCAGGAEVAAPEGTIDRYVHAIEHGDGSAAYPLLNVEARTDSDLAQYLRRFDDTRVELAEQVRTIRQTGADVQAEAVVTLDGGERVLLVLEDGQWRIADGVFDAAALRTPIDAVRSLRRRLMHGALRGLRSLVTTAEQQRWDAAVARLLETTTDPDALQIDLRGNEASVRTTDGAVIQMQRQSGRWRIVNLIELLLAAAP